MHRAGASSNNAVTGGIVAKTLEHRRVGAVERRICTRLGEEEPSRGAQQRSGIQVSPRYGFHS